MSSGFISEAELSERRRARQEEWEKVRKPEDPEEAPEEQYDHRSLYERLEEQKQKREMEYEEAHKLKNMIKGLDDDEVEFLDLVDRSKLEQERRKCNEEAREIKDFREAVASLQEKSLEQRISTEIRQPVRPPAAAQPSGLSSLGSRSSQTRLLAGAVVRKRLADSAAAGETTKKPCTSSDQSSENAVKSSSETEEISKSEKEGKVSSEEGQHEKESKKRKEREEPDTNGVTIDDPSLGGALRCIGILPGMGSYHDSSDSEQSSDTDQDLPIATHFDLLGRKLQVGIKKSSRSSSER